MSSLFDASASIKHSNRFPSHGVLVVPPLIFRCTTWFLRRYLSASDLIMKAAGKSGIDAISR